MATRTKKSEGTAAPKRPRRNQKAVANGSALSTPTAPAEAADMGQPGYSVVAPGAKTVDKSQIAQRAYELYEQSGWQPGHDLDHWFTAEAELRSGR
jgi:Protein of unknown function (DUF2934)